MFTNNFIFGSKKKKSTNNTIFKNNYDLINNSNHLIKRPIEKPNEYIVNDNEFPSELDSTFNSESESKSTTSSEYKEDPKKYWEFGNRGIKLRYFNKLIE